MVTCSVSVRQTLKIIAPCCSLTWKMSNSCVCWCERRVDYIWSFMQVNCDSVFQTVFSTEAFWFYVVVHCICENY